QLRPAVRVRIRADVLSARDRQDVMPLVDRTRALVIATLVAGGAACSGGAGATGGGGAGGRSNSGGAAGAAGQAGRGGISTGGTSSGGSAGGGGRACPGAKPDATNTGVPPGVALTVI